MLVLTVVTIVLLLVMGVNIIRGAGKKEKTTAMENAHGTPDEIGATVPPGGLNVILNEWHHIPYSNTGMIQ